MSGLCDFAVKKMERYCLDGAETNGFKKKRLRFDLGAEGPKFFFSASSTLSPNWFTLIMTNRPTLSASKSTRSDRQSSSTTRRLRAYRCSRSTVVANRAGRRPNKVLSFTL
ncbi:unnamed protein product [Ixodes pacificus]